MMYQNTLNFKLTKFSFLFNLIHRERGPICINRRRNFSACFCYEESRSCLAEFKSL